MPGDTLPTCLWEAKYRDENKATPIPRRIRRSCGLSHLRFPTAGVVGSFRSGWLSWEMTSDSGCLGCSSVFRNRCVFRTRFVCFLECVFAFLSLKERALLARTFVPYHTFTFAQFMSELRLLSSFSGLGHARRATGALLLPRTLLKTPSEARHNHCLGSPKLTPPSSQIGMAQQRSSTDTPRISRMTARVMTT